MNRSIWIYGALMGVLFALLQVVEYRYAIRDIDTNILIGLLALVFVTLGVWIGLQFNKKEKPEDLEEAQKNIQTRLSLLKISPREYEVLQLIDKGLSNQQIADQLYISLSTVKSHNSKLFSKLEVQRRTQVIQKAKELELITI